MSCKAFFVLGAAFRQCFCLAKFGRTVPEPRLNPTFTLNQNGKADKGYTPVESMRMFSSLFWDEWSGVGGLENIALNRFYVLFRETGISFGTMGEL